MLNPYSLYHHPLKMRVPIEALLSDAVEDTVSAITL